MSVVHYPGMVLTLVFTAFLGGMLALYVRLPQEIWRLTMAILRRSHRSVACLRRVGARVLTALLRRSRRTPRPPAQRAFRFTYPAHPWRPRPRLVVLIADPIARRARADQLREALTDLLRAHVCASAERLTVEVASEARFSGAAYVAYLVHSRATGVTRIRLATSSPDGAAIGVDMQHTRLADLFPYLDDGPAITFVGLPVADPSSPVVTIPPSSGIGAVTQPRIALSGGTFAEPSGIPVPRSPSADGAGRRSGGSSTREPAPIGTLADTDSHIPYGDHEAPVS